MSDNNQDLLISRQTTLDVGGIESEEENIKKINDCINNRRTQTQTIPTKFFALGGIGEVGKNTYCLEHDNEIIIIDAGIKFVNKKLYPGLTGTVVGISYLIQYQHKIKGLFITHGHEDHIGGIAHILKKIKIPVIYSPVIASELILRKLNEHKIPNQKIVLFDKKSVFSTEHFVVDFFKVNHSIPDAYGMCVCTPNGFVVTSGDFRFDFGSKSDKFDLQKVSQIATRKIDLLLCESTNAEQPGFNESEKVVISELNNIISSSTGRVIITFFASNLARIEEIIKISINSNRKIVILGRSIDASITASQKVGYLKINKKIFISPNEIQNFTDNEILIICTGSQGEENAVLNNISKQKHPWIKLKPTDNIIFSSNVIPGNSLAVDEVINRLYKSGCNIFVNSPTLKTHSSGHASKLEQQLFVSLINSNYLIPIHGEFRMLKELKRNCIELGFNEKNIFILSNGQVAQLLNRVVTVTDEKIDTTPLFIVGNEITPDGDKIVKYRESLGRDGILFLHLFLNWTKREICALSPITNVGSFYLAESIQELKKMSGFLMAKISEKLKNPEVTLKDIENFATNLIKQEVLRVKKQKPFIKLLVTTTNSKEELFNEAILPKNMSETQEKKDASTQNKTETATTNSAPKKEQPKQSAPQQ